MSIFYNELGKVFTLETNNSTYQMHVSKYGYLLHLYYGGKIPDANLTYLLQSIDRGFSGNPYEAENDRTFSLDTLPQEYSTFGTGDYRESCLNLVNLDGSTAADLRYISHQILDGKPELAGLPAVYADKGEAQTLEITLDDTVSNVQVVLQYSVLEKYDTITRSAKIINNGTKCLCIKKALSCCIDFNSRRDFDFISFYGRHSFERSVERTSTRHGKLRVDSARGTSSHHQNPFVILCEQNAGETNGECYGFSFMYSGNFMAQAEVDQVNQTRFVMGINSEAFSWDLDKGESFQTPEVILSYSSNGLEKLSHNYHKLLQEHVCRGIYKKKCRPVLINNWEATYFDFDEQKLLDIANDASKLGAEMLVIDDGWFGKRDGDLSGLGDWTVNTNKIPCGLNELCKKVNEIGLKLGIWFEPEMVSEDSDLYRNHSDWCLNIPGRKGVRSRFQFVLDLSRKEVIEYLYNSVSSVLRNANIEYVKWDMNRHLSNVYSAVIPSQRQGEVWHRYVLGLYKLLERLTSEFPNVLFEGCSGGGGRFDAGMLYYTPQIWCSDNTDAIDRIDIQYGTSFGYPISSVGSHVSACPNHQTHRVTPLNTRGIVAMSGTFGYELDITKMSSEEKVEIKNQIIAFHENYDIITHGDYYRLTNPCTNREYAAWLFVSEDQSKALFNFVLLRSQSNPPLINIKLRGLSAQRTYSVNGQEQLYTGAALMNAGFVVPVTYGDYEALQFVITVC